MPAALPPEVADVLRAAGWSPQQRHSEPEVAAAVEVVRSQVGRHGARIEPFPAATEALTEFGGLHLVQDGPGRDLCRRPFVIDATPVAAVTETLADLGRRLHTKLFPIGLEEEHESVLAVDETGRVFALDHTGVWYLGESVAAAITTLVTGAQPPRLDANGNW